MSHTHVNYPYSLHVTDATEGQRLDSFLAHHFPTLTRSHLKRVLTIGNIKLNNKTVKKAGTIVHAGDVIHITFPEKRAIKSLSKVPDIGIDIIYEHKNFLIINKPAGVLVHPPIGMVDETITLADWLASAYPETLHVGEPERPGIVHRLDRYTSGIMMIARNQDTFKYLQEQFKKRTIKKEYRAVVLGNPHREGSITLPIDRHPVLRQQMTTATQEGRESCTNYAVLQYFSEYAYIAAWPITGRTHQIRVHLAGIGHPILGDALYGRKSHLIGHQALHAHKLTFPFHEEQFSFTAPIPKYMSDVLVYLETHNPAPTVDF